MPDRIREYYRYLPIGPADHRWGLYVTGAGYQPSPLGTNRLPRRGHPPGHFYTWKAGRVLDEYAVLYVTHGQGEFESAPTGRVDVEAGDFLILFPGVWHRYRPNKAVGWGTYWVHFRGEIVDNLFERGFISPDRAVLRIGSDESILASLNRILDGLRTESAGFQQTIASHALVVLATAIGAARSAKQTSRVQQIVRELKLLLEESQDRLPVIEELIARYDVGRAHLFRIFKSQTGLTPYQYHLQLKLRRAGEMLRTSELSVKQVAKAMNFQSPYHFSRLFKKKTGLSPSDYRERLNGEAGDCER
ncbi:MAG: AraC family transcriptional regulator [Planctomycetaceae bacterium]|nr:AraC family transcriptional regulator [Planctomycetaceae bacterium]